jgi:hypothetical protein
MKGMKGIIKQVQGSTFNVEKIACHGEALRAMTNVLCSFF